MIAPAAVAYCTALRKSSSQRHAKSWYEVAAHTTTSDESRPFTFTASAAMLGSVTSMLAWSMARCRCVAV